MCIWRMFVFMSVVVTGVGVCGNVCCSVVCVCIVDVMDVVFCVCIVKRGAVSAGVWESVLQMLYVCVLCASCGSS